MGHHRTIYSGLERIQIQVDRDTTPTRVKFVLSIYAWYMLCWKISAERLDKMYSGIYDSMMSITRRCPEKQQCMNDLDFCLRGVF
jgi:hypothetical protein